MLPGLTFSTPILLLLLPLVLGWAAWLWLRERGNLSPRRHHLALALRLVIMGALILVLAGATWLQPETRQATIFVADVSASVGSQRDREVAFIAHALRARGREDVAAIVAVGGDALVEQPVAGLSGFAGFQSVVDRGATDLEAGLNLAGALFPVGYRKRVVLLTDGQQNVGDASGAARLLRDEGARLDVVPLVPSTGAEALVEGVDAPPSLRRGARVPLTVHLRSTVTQAAALSIYDGSRLVQSLPVTLSAGTSQVDVSLPALGSGFHGLRVVLQPTIDTVAENNEGDAYTRVLGAPRVLVAEGSPGEGNVVAAALRAKGMLVRQIDAAQVQPSVSYLRQFDAVALVDVPALSLDLTLLDPAASPLRSYVDGGGGLVVIGGPNSYGVGGYTDTALDEVLPVSMKLPQRKDTPSVAVALVIEDLETASNVNISKIAGEGVIKLLTPADQIEVNDASGTDSPNNGWAVPLQYVLNKPAIDRAIDAMNPVDPMSYQPALTAAYNSLRHVKAKIKHIILLGDGDAEDTYYPLVHKIRQAGMTISTVATGGGTGGFGADYATMQNIARWGGGRYYQSDNVDAIPQIFLKETKQIARTGIVEGRFNPEIVNESPIIADLPGVPLDGYVATSPKPAGTIVLTHITKHGLDPILAQWQYGLGRAVAWTSDAQGRWSANLISNGQGNRLWANMVSWVLPPESSPNLAFASSISGGKAHLTVTTNGLPLDAQVTASVVDPQGKAATVTLPPTAPGQYEADVPAVSPGAYLTGIRALVHGRDATTPLRTGFVVPYAPEYRTTGADQHLLNDVTAIGGGTLLNDPARSFADNVPAVYAPRPLTPLLLLLALLLLPFDVGVRRLLIDAADLRAWLAALRRRPALQPAMAPAGAAAPLATVRARRATRRERVAASSAQQPAAPTAAASGTQQPAPPIFPADSGAAQAPRTARVATPAAPPRPVAPVREERPAPAAPPAATSSPEPSATASRLLDAKRRRRGGS